MTIFGHNVLDGKTILVTGGSGLGLEIAKALHAKGAVAHICGRRPDALAAAVSEIAARGESKVHWHNCDIRDADLSNLTDAQLQAARDAIPQSTERDKASRAT
jgi:NAD(P)-dependent dehydrogenase (short-subunit alcohol dehydrogenase family)